MEGGEQRCDKNSEREKANIIYSDNRGITATLHSPPTSMSTVPGTHWHHLEELIKKLKRGKMVNNGEKQTIVEKQERKGTTVPASLAHEGIG